MCYTLHNTEKTAQQYRKILHERNYTESGSPRYKFEIINPTPMDKRNFLQD